MPPLIKVQQETHKQRASCNEPARRLLVCVSVTTSATHPTETANPQMHTWQAPCNIADKHETACSLAEMLASMETNPSCKAPLESTPQCSIPGCHAMHLLLVPNSLCKCNQATMPYGCFLYLVLCNYQLLHVQISPSACTGVVPTMHRLQFTCMSLNCCAHAMSSNNNHR